MGKAKTWPVISGSVKDSHIKRGEATIIVEEGVYYTEMDVIQDIPTDERLMDIYNAASHFVTVFGLRLETTFKMPAEGKTLREKNSCVMIFFRENDQLKAARLTEWRTKEFLHANIENAIKRAEPSDWIEWRSS
jgi:hypothetical protein